MAVLSLEDLRNQFDTLFSAMQQAIAEKAPKRKISSMIHGLKRLEEAIAEAEQEEQRRRQEEEARARRAAEAVACELPMDWENAFWGDRRTEGVHIDSIPDALVRCRNELGRVDIEYISAVTGESCKSIIGALKGAIFQNPDTWEECFYKGWEMAEEYLSGNLMRKLRAVQAANERYGGYFRENEEALLAVMPPAVGAKDIYITLGSPWVPVDIIDDFITYFLDLHRPYTGTRHDELTATWELENKGDYRYLVRNTSTYGTARITALQILEKTLNMRTVSVSDTEFKRDRKGNYTEKRVVNQAETVLALSKQKELIELFQNWVWRSPRRKARLKELFEERFGCIRRRCFDGSFLTFPTMNPEIALYPYQKNAVARILFTPNTLLAHDVGSGKTYVMAAAAMELRRMGLSKKNLFVVPNNIIGQWRQIFTAMYPQANLLCVEPGNFVPAKRLKALETIRDGDFDGILMAYSCFEQIPISKEFLLEQMTEEMQQLDKALRSRKKTTASLRRHLEELTKKRAQLAVEMESLDSKIFFDQLGITRLFVDEAHNFKNVPVDTKIDKVLGISRTGSKKCREMLQKVRCVQRAGGGVIMATGTPITNSVTDVFIMQLYLQNGELSLLDLQNFDSWIGMFAERVTDFEVDVDTSGYRLATRFSRFHNLPELTALLAGVADFHQTDQHNDLPHFGGYRDAVLARNPDFVEYLKEITLRADGVRSGAVARTEDNMLKITTDGRKAALDLRLVQPLAPFSYNSKVMRCAENVFHLYMQTRGNRSTQLVFCDTSTPKKEFNMYGEIRHLLVMAGIPEGEIAFVHDAQTDSARLALFRRVQEGEVRVLLGSTFKLGMGVNVQRKLIAIHHLDVPWRPADMTQREGRILRQGNENPEVYIYRYITEGSFDAYSWQLLETKQRFITELLSGSLTQRSGSDIEDIVLSYAEVKALAVGNPVVKQRVETANELSRLLALQRKTVEQRLRLERELAQMPAQLRHHEELLEKARADAAYLEGSKQVYTPEAKRALRSLIHRAVQDNVLATRETTLLAYQGFHLVLPSNMDERRPFLWLQRQGRYRVELGETEKGDLIRIDHFLENFPAHVQRMEEGLQKLLQHRQDLERALEETEHYGTRIEQCRRKLQRLDDLLGVSLAS